MTAPTDIVAADRAEILLRTGQRAPAFIAKDVFGNTINLQKYKKKYVLVAFMRYSGCPYCNLTIHRLSLEFPLLQQNDCDVVTFVQSNRKDIVENIYGRHKVTPPFPIIPDIAKRFYDTYSVRSSASAFFVGQIPRLPYWLESVGKHGFKQRKITGDYFLVPALFLIRTKDQKIMSAQYGKSFYDDDVFTKIYETLTFDVTT